MTYCLAIALDEGLVFASDSRIHDSPDQVSTDSKMHCFGTAGQRQLVLLCAGNLLLGIGYHMLVKRFSRSLFSAASAG